jgi:Ser/Thr protein kinase RdoA (MazF antagonist)
LPEELLPGGNVSGRVVRIGSTVRKPGGPATDAVHALLEHLRSVGFRGAPRSFGRDEQGRHVLEYVPGVLAMDEPVADLARVGRLIRDLHDALAEFRAPVDAAWQVPIPPDREDLVCHHDLAPWNLVVGDDRWVFIDWDGAGPGSRLWDLGYAAHGFVPLHAGGSPAVDAARLRVLADGYGLDAAQREAVPGLAAAHIRGMYDLLCDGARTGTQPWARLHAEGHADHWGPAADYTDTHLTTFRTALLTPPRTETPPATDATRSAARHSGTAAP